MIRLIAMDLDGTLLNSQKEISRKNLEALNKAKEKGVYITIATGRMMNSAVYFGRLIGANAPLVCCNGGLVQRAGEAPVFTAVYDVELAQELMRYVLGEKKWYMQWHIGTEIYGTDFRPEYFYAYRTVPDFHIVEVGQNYLSHAEGIMQFVLRDLTGEHMEEKLSDIKAKFPGRFEAVTNVDTVTDIMPIGITKATGVEALAKHLGLSRDEVMCCGDAENDLSMLEWAGTAVVTANGIQAARDIADYIAPSCDEDAIADAVERFVL